MLHLTRMLAKDGEGATKLLECSVAGAPDEECAGIVAKSVISSPLLKCAVFGEDANWGRVLCAIGYADADFRIDRVGVSISSKNGAVEVCRDGAGIPFSEETAKEVLAADEITAPSDVAALLAAAGCGVTLLATAHGEGREDLLRRPLYRPLLEEGVFRRLVRIERPGGKRVYTVEEPS